MTYLHQQTTYTRAQFEAAMATLWADNNECQVNSMTPQLELCFETVSQTLNELGFDE